MVLVVAVVVAVVVVPHPPDNIQPNRLCQTVSARDSIHFMSDLSNHDLEDAAQSLYSSDTFIGKKVMNTVKAFLMIFSCQNRFKK